MNNRDEMVGGIYVEDGGQGSVPVVFIHSLAGNTGQWRAQVEHLRPGRRAVALDLRGHGRSAPAADGKYDIGSMTDDVKTVIDALGVGRVVLVGHSMGGLVAAVFAGRYPRQVAGVLFVDPSGDARQAPQQEIRAFLAALASDNYAAVIEGYWKQILAGATAETEAAVMEALRQTPKETVLGVMDDLFEVNPAIPGACLFENKRSVVAGNSSTFAVIRRGFEASKLVKNSSFGASRQAVTATEG